MKNYLMLNNKKIELTPEQVKEIENSFGFNKIKLSEIPVGETFKVGGFEFIVLEQHGFETSVILKDFWKIDAFDKESNNYEESSIRTELNSAFYEEISGVVGKDNLIQHEVDLTADDGRTDYGVCDDYISLLTGDMYRKYVYILEKYNPKKYWWLATPHSVATNGYVHSVRCVDGVGALRNDRCSSGNGVRPFCILKSSIFVSR